MPMPRLTLAHSTRAAHDLDRMLAFYCDVLGFQVTDRGKPSAAQEMVFLSQDPRNHHQIVLVTGQPERTQGFVMADHLAFRTGSLDDLREIGRRLQEAGVESVIELSHGIAWSLYFTDPEGNGVECFVDSPFHVAQPYGTRIDLSASDEDLAAATEREIQGLRDFQPFETWSKSLDQRLDAR